MTPVPPPTTTTTTTLPTTACIDPVTGLEGPTPAIRVRRFSLSRIGDSLEVRANGRFSFPGSLDLAASGLALSIEDGSGRPLFEKAVRGSDLVPTRLGWGLASELDSLPRLDIDPGITSALVTMRSTLPVFDPVEASGTASGGGVLRWLVRFGDSCPGVATLYCRTRAEGELSCDLQ